MAVVGFHEVFEQEIVAINSRRGQQKSKRHPAVLEEAGTDPDDKPIPRPKAGSDLIGLALSGGGVRSASFCLGVLQALDEVGVLKRVDYLSTVSGGGYIGTSMVAAMSSAGDSKFPFPSDLKPEELPAVRHIRDHSNYLFPRGKIDVFYNLAIYLRGLVANAILLLPYLLFAAAITVLWKPTVRDLAQPSYFAPFGFTSFGTTMVVALVITGLLAAWALYRSIWRRKRDVGARWTAIAGIALLLIPAAAICELHSVVLATMFDAGSWEIARPFGEWGGFIASIFLAYGSIVGFLSSFLAGLLKRGTESPSRRARGLRIVAKAAVYIAAAAVPLIIWIGYLYLSYWGICKAQCDLASAQYSAPDWIKSIFQVARNAVGMKPGWLYFVTGMLFFLVQMFLRPNANSLHRLYRDRLSKAFLFDPSKPAADGLMSLIRLALRRRPRSSTTNGQRSVSTSRAPLDDLKLSKVRCKFAPYQIINAALNIRGSKYANQRGRDADFFVFTPKFTGSRATGYVSTADIESRVADLDLAAAMAISGAAASSNMGSNTIKVLSPTLAILNIRLGFWLPNPRVIADGRVRSSWAAFIARFYVPRIYILREIIGNLEEDSDQIYLTDGGHIENLGIFELLRRRCRLIIAVDAEADREMSFNSFIALQRHALIDLGVLVSLPWAEIREATRAAAKEIGATGGVGWSKAPHGPHVALGEIKYPSGAKGVLLYVKSSLTGDENDYVVDYKRRFPNFPHETTADQLFTEEQFEVYRALGFHAMRHALNGDDRVAMTTGPVRWRGRALHNPLVKTARSLLFGHSA